MRGKMRSPEKKSYSPAFVIGQPLYGYGIGVILRSENPGVAVGKYVYSGEIPHQQYTIFPASFKTFRFIEKHPKLSLTTYVGAAGMPGQTAYMGWKEFSKAKPGETAFITTGGGPVGSFVIQLAKKDGLEVIGSAGSEEKVEFMKSIGADVAFNYKTIDTREVLKEAGGIDIYWDNVGGDMLDAALEYSNVYGRFLQCGMVSGNNTGMIPIKNLNQTYIKSLTLSGILVLRLLVKYEEEFYAVAHATGMSAGQIAQLELRGFPKFSRQTASRAISNNYHVPDDLSEDEGLVQAHYNGSVAAIIAAGGIEPQRGHTHTRGQGAGKSINTGHTVPQQPVNGPGNNNNLDGMTADDRAFMRFLERTSRSQDFVRFYPLFKHNEVTYAELENMRSVESLAKTEHILGVALSKKAAPSNGWLRMTPFQVAILAAALYDDDQQL
ncbi:alcohol dehydrogenase [Mycena kentingensis (nom. inval.)]|nr:alcohol dehydrogenase [Mycena kentingensis (nom. inval.)]